MLTGTYRTGRGGLVAYVAEQGGGYTDEQIVGALLDAGACACGAGHWERWYRDADSIASSTGRPRREVRRACERLTRLGVLEVTTDGYPAWRLSEAARTMARPVGPEQGEDRRT